MIYKLVFSILILWIITVMKTTASECPTGWSLFRSNCYYLDTTFRSTSFYGAASTCQIFGANLVSIEDQQENDHVQQMCRMGNRTVGSCWIGLSRPSPVTVPDADVSVRRQGWQWLDGQPYIWMNWRDSSSELVSEPQTGESQTRIIVSLGKWYGSTASDISRVLQTVCKRGALGATTTATTTTTPKTTTSETTAATTITNTGTVMSGNVSVGIIIGAVVGLLVVVVFFIFVAFYFGIRIGRKESPKMGKSVNGYTNENQEVYDDIDESIIGRSSIHKVSRSNHEPTNLVTPEATYYNTKNNEQKEKYYENSAGDNQGKNTVTDEQENKTTNEGYTKLMSLNV